MEDVIDNKYAKNVDTNVDPVDRTWYIPHYDEHHKIKPSKQKWSLTTQPSLKVSALTIFYYQIHTSLIA